MTRRLIALALLGWLGLSLGGCTRCGWIWEDWQQHACRSDRVQ